MLPAIYAWLAKAAPWNHKAKKLLFSAEKNAWPPLSTTGIEDLQACNSNVDSLMPVNDLSL
jgi:hypothetical protein